ncbi:MAG: hypothetical protein ABI669_01465 [Usitatibacter sp.]
MPIKFPAWALLPACCTLLLAGCASVPSQPQGQLQPGAAEKTQTATIHFRGDTDTEVAWMNKSTNMQWGLLFARGDVVVVEEKQVAGQPPSLVNSPRLADTDFLNRMATVKGIPNGQAKTITIESGVYDWLVLIDIQGDGIIDGYLGTQASQGPLAAFEFLPGKDYFIDVDRKGDLSFRIEPDATREGERNGESAYLALMDSVAERLPEVDESLLREYVELIVEEIESLRKVPGDHCYGMIQSEDRKNVTRAFNALPPHLRVRESALIDRVLRAPLEERELMSDDEALEAMEPISAELRRIYGDDADIIEDDEAFRQAKDLGCRVYRDMLALTLLMPAEQAAPIWRFMFSEKGDDEEDERDERPPVTNI